MASGAMSRLAATEYQRQAIRFAGNTLGIILSLVVCGIPVR